MFAVFLMEYTRNESVNLNVVETLKHTETLFVRGNPNTYCMEHNAKSQLIPSAGL